MTKFFFFIALMAPFFASAQSDTALFAVEGTPVFPEEFQYVYKKNNFNNEKGFTKSDVDEYLELYINFKLKIKEAMELGIDTTKQFKDEFNTYKDQLTQPYLVETGETEKLIKEAYERMKFEVRASHILITVDKSAPPKDTLAAYSRIMEIYQMAIKGENFASLALANSGDPSAKTNGGDLGYFSAFRMVYTFESAAYNTEVGKVSKPIRTQFGYHIIKVADKRPTAGQTQVSHIMLRTSKTATAEQANKVQGRIFEIADHLEGGADWAAICQQYSEDQNTSKKGGQLPPFSSGSILPEFEAAAFGLEEPGDYSDPFQTAFGWHIIKLDQKIDLQTFEELKSEIKRKVNRDSRAQLNNAALIARLKKENGYWHHEKNLNQIMKSVNPKLLQGKWVPNQALINDHPVFSIGKDTISSNDVVSLIQKDQRPAQYSSAEYYFNILFDKMVETAILNYEKQNLSAKYPEYRMLVREYREGIMLFQLMEEKVWNKAVEDTVGLENFFASNRDNYLSKPKIEATIFEISDQNQVKELKKMAKAMGLKKKPLTDDQKKELETRFNSVSQLNLRVADGSFEKTDNEVLEAIKWKVGNHVIESENKTDMVFLRKILEPRNQELSEIKGVVISDYQTELEKDWIKELKGKYKVDLNIQVLNKVYERLVSN